MKRIFSVLFVLLFSGLACSMQGEQPVTPAPTDVPVATPTSQPQTNEKSSTDWSFDDDPTAAGVKPVAGDWKVQADLNAPSAPNVLCQAGPASDGLLRLGDQLYPNLTVTTRLRVSAGQAGGVVFRYRNPKNYYLLSLDAANQRLALLKKLDGVITEVSGSGVEFAPDSWHLIKLEVSGSSIKGSFDDQLLIETADDQFASGLAALWTRTDALTCFDDTHLIIP